MHATLLFLILAGLLTVGPSNARACQAASFNGYAALNESGNTARDIIYYIQSDFASRMTATTTTTVDDALTEAQVRRGIIAQAEKWNAEGAGQNLIYGGALDLQNPSQICTSTSERPAVYIHFDINLTAGGNVSLISGCLGAVHMRIGPGGYGDSFGSRGVGFENVVFHEFGHVLELGHAHSESPPECHSVMAYANGCTDTAQKQGNTGHARGWDRDCLPVYQNHRSAETRYLGFSSTGTQRPVVTNFYLIAKSGVLGGDFFTINGWPSIFFPSVLNWIASVGADGYFSFSSFGSATVDENEPKLMFELADVSSHVGALSKTEYDWSSSFDAPYLAQQKFSTTFSTSSTVDWSRCTTSACTSLTEARSFLPLVPTYDPVSQRTAYALSFAVSVRSQPLEHIYVFPGHYDSSYYMVLNNWKKFRNPRTEFPSASGPWVFTGQTPFAPSIACGDVGTYNCLMAWVDRGTWNGAVLYTYFRINTSTNQVEFVPDSNGNHTAWWRGATDTASRPSVAFFADKFWMAWKTATAPSQVAWVSKDPSAGYASGWSSTNYLSEPNMATPPAFIAEDGKESMLMWTRTP